MARRLALLVMVGVLFALALGATGCASIAEKATEAAIENATGAKIDKDGEQVTIEGEDGESTTVGENVEIPADFPSDVPVYEGSVKGVFSANDSWTVAIESPDSTKDVLAFYTEKLEAEGWTKQSSMDTEDGGMYSATKGERTVTVVASADGGSEDGSTAISLAVSGK